MKIFVFMISISFFCERTFWYFFLFVSFLTFHSMKRLLFALALGLGLGACTPYEDLDMNPCADDTAPVHETTPEGGGVTLRHLEMANSNTESGLSFLQFSTWETYETAFPEELNDSTLGIWAASFPNYSLLDYYEANETPDGYREVQDESTAALLSPEKLIQIEDWIIRLCIDERYQYDGVALVLHNSNAVEVGDLLSLNLSNPNIRAYSSTQEAMALLEANIPSTIDKAALATMFSGGFPADENGGNDFWPMGNPIPDPGSGLGDVMPLPPGFVPIEFPGDPEVDPLGILLIRSLCFQPFAKQGGYAQNAYSPDGIYRSATGHAYRSYFFNHPLWSKLFFEKMTGPNSSIRQVSDDNIRLAGTASWRVRCGNPKEKSIVRSNSQGSDRIKYWYRTGPRALRRWCVETETSVRHNNFNHLMSLPKLGRSN